MITGCRSPRQTRAGPRLTTQKYKRWLTLCKTGAETPDHQILPHLQTTYVERTFAGSMRESCRQVVPEEHLSKEEIGGLARYLLDMLKLTVTGDCAG